jgi:hypothetical protein
MIKGRQFCAQLVWTEFENEAGPEFYNVKYKHDSRLF